jgi:hypothetical protein
VCEWSKSSHIKPEQKDSITRRITLKNEEVKSKFKLTYFKTIRGAIIVKKLKKKASG